ncbi:hypothetical protein BBP40_001070 [Aspergillus hancockii]|nr:hypothetical protein BBP40_001070 [Aspergillus hancockii]
MEQATSAHAEEQGTSFGVAQCVATDQQFFIRFIYNAFQTTQDYNRFRGVDYPDFTAHIISNFGRNACLDAAACAVSSIFQAQAIDASENLPNKGREAYNYALNSVSQALGDATQSSDKADIIGAIILLAIFEMRVRTLPDAWLKHVGGVQSLMEELGAEAHESGFARACYIFFRGFLLATAIHQGQPCFLEKEDWQRLAERIRVEDSRKPGENAVFVNVTDRIFMELVKFPRYAYEAKYECETQQRQQAFCEAIELRYRILESQSKLMALVHELKDLIRKHIPNQRGPAYALYGAENAIDLSDSIVKRLTANPVPIRVSSGLHLYIEQDFIARDATLLDNVACSMGMLAITVEACDLL